MRRRWCWICNLLLAISAPVHADVVQPTPVDGDRSSAHFAIRLVWLAQIEGAFSTLSGHVDIDKSRQLVRVDAHIEADSVSMQRSSVEVWIKSAEFFNVANYPDINFLSDWFPLAQLREGGELHGTLTLRGISKPVVFAILPPSCNAPGYACALRTYATIKRSDFGMRSRRATLADKVELSLDIFLQAPSPAASTP